MPKSNVDWNRPYHSFLKGMPVAIPEERMQFRKQVMMNQSDVMVDNGGGEDYDLKEFKQAAKKQKTKEVSGCNYCN